MKTSSTSVAKSTKGRKPSRDAILAAIKAHAASKSYTEIAAMLGVTLSMVSSIGRQAGFAKPYTSSRRCARNKRLRELIQAHAATHSLKAIGQMLGLTGERVRQICEKWGIERQNFSLSPLRGMSSRELRKLARQPERTLKEIAADAGVEAETLAEELRRRGIERFTRLERGAMLLKQGKRICCRCRRVKPLEQFTRTASHPTGHTHRCLECGAAYVKEQRQRKKGVK
ncbi:MAG: hypothetical protein NT105_04035 [Verrucomicrobia bacterium]|nr:hypothetical protein [Verrucomicrobiota bacterium]